MKKVDYISSIFLKKIAIVSAGELILPKKYKLLNGNVMRIESSEHNSKVYILRNYVNLNF